MKNGRKPIVQMALAAVLAVALAACSSFASKGTMPPPGPTSKGTMPPPGPTSKVDPNSAPDFISVAGRDGSIVGYVRKELLLPTAGTGGPGDGVWPVYDEDLRTVVGQMVPGKGFVPAGVDPATVPDIPVTVAPSGEPSGRGTGQVVLYVRNDAASQASIAVQTGGQLARGTAAWGGNTGVVCYPMSAGSRLVLLDRPADEAGASVIRSIYTRGQETEPPSLWIAVGADGAITQGESVPPWWSGGPPAC